MDILEADMRVIVRLLGETAALGGGLLAKKCYLLDGLCDIAGACEWTWALFGTGKTRAPKGFLRRKIGASFDLLPELSQPTRSLVQEESLPRTASPHVILSFRSVDEETTSQISLCRDKNDPPYSKRELALTSLVLDEIPWLHQRVLKGRSGEPKLSPRQRVTLDLLLLGIGRKEIADRIAISPGTVVGYIRELYQCFGVNSQAELMRAQHGQSAPYSNGNT